MRTTRRHVDRPLAWPEDRPLAWPEDPPLAWPEDRPLDRPRRARRRAGQGGSVTAEAALVIPVLVGITMTLVWLIGAGIAQVRCIDAARDSVRALARDEPQAAVVAAAHEMLPDGARVQVRRLGGHVEVEVSYSATPPGSWLDGAVAWPLDATASMPLEVEGGGAGA